ncbi:F-box domain-containing protein [Mycena indigotica]|uniref:F-box domain-containing protein n=1 Tax=Mycena indigotica TaxID=2126181 RepID=A0A8H6SFT0_9AGAR|nr:F-box domain-containing protein [Mycena indigotica]KAF7298716.1 F-box domain-containing protein [Mycena indigotica]
MSSLPSWPEDVLLRLAQELDVRDLINLLATCNALHALQHHRTLWISAAARLRHVQLHPLPVPMERLARLTLSQLQTVVRQANRLLQNWHSPLPRPTWTRVFSVGHAGNPGFRSLFGIPGTYLVVTAVWDEADDITVVVCWNVRTGERVCETTIRSFVLKAADSWGTIQRFPTRHNDKDARLAILILDYTDKMHVHFELVRSPPVKDAEFIPIVNWEFFLSDKLFGFITPGGIHYWTFDPEQDVQRTPSPWHDLNTENGIWLLRGVHLSDPELPMSRCLVGVGIKWECGDMTLDLLDLNSAPLDRCATRQAIQESDHEHKHTISHDLDTSINCVASYEVLVVRPDYNILSVSCRAYRVRGTRDTYSFTHFWPMPPALSGGGCAQTTDHGDSGAGPLRSICFSHESKPLTHFTGVSGRYVVQQVHHPDDRGPEWDSINPYHLALVFLDPNGQPNYRKLPLEGEAARCLQPDRCIFADWGRVLDETLGLVVLLDRAGTLTVISYM